MKVKKFLIKIIIVYIIIMIIISSNFFVYAGGAEIKTDFNYQNPKAYIDYDINNVGNQAQNFINKSAEHSDRILGYVLGVLQIITLAMAIIMLIFYGIRYVTSANNGEKGKMKNIVSKNYIIGIVLLFGASAILSLAYNMVNDILIM